MKVIEYFRNLFGTFSKKLNKKIHAMKKVSTEKHASLKDCCDASGEGGAKKGNLW